MNEETNQSAPSNALVLVVMEWNAEWPTEIDAYDLGCAVLKQEVNETYPELIRRTKARVASIQAADGVVRKAILACGDRHDASTFGGRLAVACALLQGMRDTRAELRIVAPAGTAASSRQPFVALAGELTGSLSGSTACVHVRFPEAPTHRGAGAARRHGRAHDRRPYMRDRRPQAQCS